MANFYDIPCITNAPTSENSGIFLITNPTTILEKTMGVQTKEHQEPHRLICIQLLCPYPGCGKVGDSIGLECIDLHFGIRCCSKHRKNAHADCATWMKNHGRCQISEEFLIGSELKDKTFSVTRSNGNVEDDWKISSQSFGRAELVRTTNGSWGIVMTRPGHDIIKTVPLRDLDLETLLVPLIEALPDDEFVIKQVHVR